MLYKVFFDVAAALVPDKLPLHHIVITQEVPVQSECSDLLLSALSLQ